MTMKKQILYILYSLCGMGILWFCTACTEQDELPAADLQPLAFTIGAPLPFQEMTAGASGFTPQTASMDDPHPHLGFGNNPVVE